MEFWFKDERTDGNPLDKNQIFQLPINPQGFEVQVSANNETFESEGMGEINIIGKKKLAVITFSSFFPAQNYNFCECTPRDDPYDYVWILENFMHWKSPIRFIVTGTNINSLYSIDNFTYKENPMGRDIEYTITLKEYKKLS